MIKVTLVMDGDKTLSMWHSGGTNVVGGTVVDALEKHVFGEQRLKRIEIDPESQLPSELHQTSTGS